MGIVSRNRITINEIGEEKSEIIMNYKFHLKYWQLPFKNLLKKLFTKWNDKIWNEDYPVKIRRQKILNLNFRDFIGLPLKRSERKFKGKKYKLVLPVKRYKNSSRDQHPLSFKRESN